MPTFKTHSPQALAAQRAYDAGNEALLQAGRAFAALYPGAKPVYRFDVNGREFHGLRFEPALVDPMWTKPLRAGGFIQRPRTAPARGTKGEARRQEIIALGDLNEQYGAARPTTKAERNPLFEALGMNWSDALLGGFEHFEQDGCVYFKTGTSVRADHWVEVLGSEYDLAKALYLAEQQERADKPQQEACAA